MFYSKDLTSEDSADVLGLGFVGSVCTDGRYSISEDFGGFSSVHVVAHEMGHNFNSFHDGDTDYPIAASCSDEDNYIMAPYVPGSDFFENSVLFSNCSIQQFKEMLLVNNMAPSNVAQCLLTATPIVPPGHELPPNQQLPGQSFTPDDQCRKNYGDSFSYCPEANIDMCELLFCRNVTFGSCTRKDAAAEGTTCGSGQVINNQIKT
jgi:hypothetical protein